MIYRKPKTQPESVGAARLRRYMEARGWFLKKLHGNKFQSGMPDYVAFHATYKMRWIENKTLEGRLKPSQVRCFTEMAEKGEKIYVCFDEVDYDKLFGPDNWRDFR